MSRGLGKLQRRLLVSIAAMAEGHERGARVFDVLTLWSHLDHQPRQAFDRANLHRGLHALAARGLIAATDHADYTPRCVCGHGSDDHKAGTRACLPCIRRLTGFARWRRLGCLAYRPRPRPRPRWYARLTPVGARLLNEADQARVVAQWQALQRERREALARLQAGEASLRRR